MLDDEFVHITNCGISVGVLMSEGEFRKSFDSTCRVVVMIRKPQ